MYICTRDAKSMSRAGGADSDAASAAPHAMDLRVSMLRRAIGGGGGGGGGGNWLARAACGEGDARGETGAR
jgi:hypothetical protein